MLLEFTNKLLKLVKVKLIVQLVGYRFEIRELSLLLKREIKLALKFTDGSINEILKFAQLRLML